MGVGILTPNLERRLNAYQQIADRKKVKKEVSNITVTISREFGCEAFPIAEKLQSFLIDHTGKNWIVYDKSLLDAINENQIGDIGDSSRYMDLLGSFFRNYETHGERYKKLTDYMVEVAEVGNAIIVGRGGSVVAQNLSNCYHFRLIGNDEFKVKSISHRMNLPIDEAKKQIQLEQDSREKFLKDYLGENIADVKWYDGVFNNSRIESPVIAECIFTCIRARL